jgi:hypothetical protein
MTLDEAIKHCEEKCCDNTECSQEHKQLAEWLKQLKKLKEQYLQNLDALGAEFIIMDKMVALEKENKELKEELIEAYQRRGDWYMAGEKESIDERIEELKS